MSDIGGVYFGDDFSDVLLEIEREIESVTSGKYFDQGT